MEVYYLIFSLCANFTSCEAVMNVQNAFPTEEACLDYGEVATKIFRDQTASVTEYMCITNTQLLKILQESNNG